MGAFAIVGLIISILRAIPDFIALVNFILGLIKKGDKKLAVERKRKLLGLLREARSDHDYSRLGRELEKLKEELEKEVAGNG